MATRAYTLDAETTRTRQSGFPVRGILLVAARTLALWIGGLTLVNVAASLRHPGFDLNLWWIDLRFLPRSAATLLLAIAGALLVAAAVRPPTGGIRRVATLAALAGLTAVATLNAAAFYVLWSRGTIAPRSPVPLSALVAGILGGVTAAIRIRPGEREAHPRPPRAVVVVVGAIVSMAFLVGVPVAQMAVFGTTDYRRSAEAIVVFGAKVEADGRPSITLADRVTTAAELYRQGAAPRIILSGGIDPSGMDETIAMRDLAEELGVPREAIVLDPRGVTTSATVDNAARMFREDGTSRVLAVSQYYHLARIKLAFARAGFDVWTVPSRATPIPQNRTIAAREIPAFWSYYLRAIL